MGDFDDLFPAPRRVTLLGRQVDILPAALPLVGRAARVIEGWQRIVTAPAPIGVFADEALAMAPDLAALLNIPEAEIAACPAQDLPALVAAINHVVAANAGFFALRVLPGLAAGLPEVRAAMTAAAEPDGPTFSPSSSAGGTAGQT